MRWNLLYLSAMTTAVLSFACSKSSNKTDIDSDTEDSDADTEDASVAPDEADEMVFRNDLVHQIRFTLTQDAYAEIDQGDRLEVHAAMNIDELSYSDVGLKLKGAGSYQPIGGKPAFIVDMNQWVKGTTFHGLKAFKLHNGMMYDPTRTHEYLSYLLARSAGLMAPRVGWAEVWCNDEYKGIYMLVEKHDDILIAHTLPNQKDLGVVLEPTAGDQSVDPSYSFKDFGMGLLSPELAEPRILLMWEEGPLPPNPGVIESMVAVDELLGAPLSEAAVTKLWEHVDENSFLDYMAWETVVSHTDGYILGANWRLFVDGANFQIRWLPSGADSTWTRVTEVFSTGTGTARIYCMQVPSCALHYAEHVLEMADRAEALDLLGKYYALATWLAPKIAEDPSLYPDQSISDLTVQFLTENPAQARNQVYAAYPDLKP